MQTSWFKRNNLILDSRDLKGQCKTNLTGVVSQRDFTTAHIDETGRAFL